MKNKVICEIISEIAKKMTVSRTKASSSITDRFSDKKRENLCKEVQAANAGFVVRQDNNQSRQEANRSPDLFLSEKVTIVVTKYLTNFFFVHATREDLCKYFDNFIADKKFDIPWKRLFSLSSDRSANNEKLNRFLSDKICSFNLGPLLLFVHVFCILSMKLSLKGT